MKNRFYKNPFVLPIIFVIIFTAGCNKQNSSQKNTLTQSGQIQPSPVIELLLNESTTRSFNDTPVSDEALELILKCGAQAPSAVNKQPWHFTIIRDNKLAKQIISAVKPGNVLIIISGPTSPPNGFSPQIDCSLAAQNMAIAAMALGLGQHIYTGPIKKINTDFLEDCGIPDGKEAILALLVGHIKARPDILTSASRRKSLSQMTTYK